MTLSTEVPFPLIRLVTARATYRLDNKEPLNRIRMTRDDWNELLGELRRRQRGQRSPPRAREKASRPTARPTTDLAQSFTPNLGQTIRFPRKISGFAADLTSDEA